MFKKVLLICFLVLIVGVGITIFFGNRWYREALEPLASSQNEAQTIHIQEGMSSASISQLLEEKKLIKSALAFRLYLRLSGVSSSLQAGTYRLSPNRSIAEIADILSQGNIATKTITVIPGYRLDQITESLKETGYNQQEIDNALNAKYSYSILADKPSKASLEGYLYPDTYILPLNSSAEDVIEIMIATLDERVTDKIRSNWARYGLNLHEGLTLASIIQKEVSSPEDQQKVAQIYIKRLKIGMKLEADPTFQYPALVRGIKPSIDTNSPYNTYKIKGLPPGPIAVSGQTALEAVSMPTDTDFLFFVSAPNGKSYFSKTREQHDQNVEKYLR
jgi:UPF0755 protein